LLWEKQLFLFFIFTSIQLVDFGLFDLRIENSLKDAVFYERYR